MTSFHLSKSYSVLLKSGIFSLPLLFLNFLRLLNFTISWSLQSRLLSADQFFVIGVSMGDPPMHFLLLPFSLWAFKNHAQNTPEISTSAWGEISSSPTVKKPSDHEAFLSIVARGGTGHAGFGKHGQLCQKVSVWWCAAERICISSSRCFS